MSVQSIHIISFDIPFPANYGGVIDVFYKIQNLSKEGVRIHLHCFEYGRSHSQELDTLCEKVYYYPRKTGLQSQFSLQPYIVKSRLSERLIQNLLKDKHPIIFEGMHTIGIGLDKRLENRVKIYRAANIEHDYYQNLAKVEKDLLKRSFFYTEAYRLKQFQKNIAYFNAVVTVSENDQKYLQQVFPNKTIHYIPCFHENNEITIQTGKGKYALYNGNLSVAENIKAVNYLIDEVFSKIDYPFVIAGLNPPKQMISRIEKYDNIFIRANVSKEEMHKLIQNAQFNALITFQATGLKLKLLNTLFKGRFCIANSKMIDGTGLESSCLQTETPKAIIELINKYQNTEFSSNDISKRKNLLSKQYNNSFQARRLVNIINQI